MARPFAKTFARKFTPRSFPLGIATIDGRPAYEVARERKLEMSPRRRISKAEFYKRGGLKNTDLFRKTDARGRWLHYEVIDDG